MRILGTFNSLVASLGIAGVIAMLTIAIQPALARGQLDRNTAEASAGCSSYQKADDGSWRQIPCVTAGSTAAAARAEARRSSQASN